jgi:hypothetical protein
MLNSVTKLECSVCQIGLSDFDSSNSTVSFVKLQNRLFTPPLGDIKGLSVLPGTLENLEGTFLSATTSSICILMGV